jgi:hypothetical protein
MVCKVELLATGPSRATAAIHSRAARLAGHLTMFATGNHAHDCGIHIEQHRVGVISRESGVISNSLM